MIYWFRLEILAIAAKNASPEKKEKAMNELRPVRCQEPSSHPDRMPYTKKDGPRIHENDKIRDLAAEHLSYVTKAIRMTKRRLAVNRVKKAKFRGKVQKILLARTKSLVARKTKALSLYRQATLEGAQARISKRVLQSLQEKKPFKANDKKIYARLRKPVGWIASSRLATKRNVGFFNLLKIVKIL